MSSTIAARFLQRNLQAMIAASDAAKAEREAAKSRCRGNAKLEACLRSEYARRGEVFTWERYFLVNGF